MVYAKPRIRPRERDAQHSLGFLDTNGLPNLGQTTRTSDSKKTKNKQKKTKQRAWRNVNFAIPVDHNVKLKISENRTKNLDIAMELKKTMEHESDGDTNCNWCTRYSHQRICNGTRRIGNKNMSGDHRSDNTLKISQNISPEDLRRLAVTQTTVKDH